MKEMLKSWAMVAVILFAIACGGSDDNTPENPSETPEEPAIPVRPSGVIKLALDQGLAKTSFGKDSDGAAPTAWESGEKISLFCAEADKATNETLSLRGVKSGESCHSQSTATMQWSQSDNHNFYAAYPKTDISKPKNIALSLPSIQNVVPNESPDKLLIKLVAAAERIAPSELVNIDFEPAFSMLDISFTTSDNVVINRIVVRSTDSTPIAGDFVASYSDSKWQFKPETNAQNLSSVIALHVNGDKGATLAAGDNVRFYAILMPLKVESLEVDLLTSEGKVLQYEMKEAMAGAERQKIEIGELPALASADWEPLGNTWMNYIPDNTVVSDLSLAGTHDAATAGCSLEMSRCQSLNITQQLTAGVRVFDLRPGKNFDIYHGSDKTGVKLSTALSDMVDYLNENPTQGCIAFIKNESGEDTWGKEMSAQLTPFADNLLRFKSDLTMGELRGKILILSRDSYSGTIYGGFFSSAWPDNTADGTIAIGSAQGEALETFYLQDQYDSSTEESVKISSIKSYIDKAKSKQSNAWLCNHTSLAGFKLLSFGSSPKDHAKNIHPEIINYIQSKPGRLGIVMMDYAGDKNVRGDELLTTVISQNMKYKQNVK